MTYKYKINGGFLIWVPIQSDWLEYRHDAIHDEVVSVLGNIPTHVGRKDCRWPFLELPGSETGATTLPLFTQAQNNIPMLTVVCCGKLVICVVVVISCLLHKPDERLTI